MSMCLCNKPYLGSKSSRSRLCDHLSFFFVLFNLHRSKNSRLLVRFISNFLEKEKPLFFNSKMANYQLEFRQNNEIIDRNLNWLNTNFFGFVIELQVHRRRNNGELRATNRTCYQENDVFLSERGMREFLIRILSAEEMFVNFSQFLCDNVVQLICRSPSGWPHTLPVYSLEHLVLSFLGNVLLMRNNPMNRFLTLVPIQLNLVIDESRHLQFLDDSILNGNVSLYRGLMQRLDDSVIILESHHHQSLEVGLSNTASAAVQRLKEEMAEVSTDCSICLESVGVGEIVARMPCSHLFHTTCITRWLHRKPSCPLCRAPAC
ncbi:hypothetical protein EZV62_014733 [Acer yangbiense]|uniref:RING-type domain-containing protein n=1 Tax=Acer yangbiense TaxID=1000413 RepID=A0A5C7HT18_9ROSI|nr:hypothetical protein EZV62_014733 [Acer yangbiense]